MDFITMFFALLSLGLAILILLVITDSSQKRERYTESKTTASRASVAGRSYSSSSKPGYNSSYSSSTTPDFSGSYYSGSGDYSCDSGSSGFDSGGCDSGGCDGGGGCD